MFFFSRDRYYRRTSFDVIISPTWENNHYDLRIVKFHQVVIVYYSYIVLKDAHVRSRCPRVKWRSPSLCPCKTPPYFVLPYFRYRVIYCITTLQQSTTRNSWFRVLARINETICCFRRAVLHQSCCYYHKNTCFLLVLSLILIPGVVQLFSLNVDVLLEKLFYNSRHIF